jgi:SAM-dependent methyltransferase
MASGKTTAARKLAARMQIPMFHADLVYQELHDRMGLPGEAARLIVPHQWHNPSFFGIQSWDGCKSIDDAKAPILKRMLDGTTGDFIIEGYTLGLASERKLVERVIGPHRSIVLRIKLPYEKWVEFFRTRWSKEPDTETAYNLLCNTFDGTGADAVYEFSDPKWVDVHYAPYQKEGFTDRKIEALRIPVRRGDVVNDIGCNEGLIGRWCADQGASAVHGYDTNWRFLDKARENGLIPHLSDVETDRVEPADITLCVSVFHYFENPRAFLRKARKLTRRLFILELPILPDEQRLYARFEPQGANFEVMRYSAPLIETWLRQNFRAVEHVGNSVPPDNSLRYVYHCTV